jgi:hypothetical protein
LAYGVGYALVIQYVNPALNLPTEGLYMCTTYSTVVKFVFANPSCTVRVVIAVPSAFFSGGVKSPRIEVVELLTRSDVVVLLVALLTTTTRVATVTGTA